MCSRPSLQALTDSIYILTIFYIHKFPQKYYSTRNTLDCDQSNYSSRIVFSHISTEFGQTGNSAIRSADSENLILDQTQSKSDEPPHGRDIAIWIFQDGSWAADILDLVKPEIVPFDPLTPKTPRRIKHEVDRTTPRGDMAIWNFPNVSSVVGRRSVLNIYTSSYTDLIYASSLH